MLPDQKGKKLIGKVRKRVIYDETSTGEDNYNSMHEKYIYAIEYPDGTTQQRADNTIDGNILSQVDSEGHHYQLLTEVTDTNKDDSAIAKVDGFIKSSSGNLHRKRTTRGWKIIGELKDGSFDWVPLKDLKHSKPVDLAEYDVENELSDETTLNWWVKETLRHRDRIISKVKSKYWRTSHKFGI